MNRKVLLAVLVGWALSIFISPRALLSMVGIGRQAA